jgi:hypothetical protein
VNAGRPTPILILPGMNGSGTDHWQTIWERLLPRARRVPARDWDRPVCADWVAALERAVAASGSEVVLVAHSLGCLQVAHWASQTALAARAALLVAPPDPNRSAFPAAALGFAPLPLVRLPFASTVVASEDDPYATLVFSRRCAQAWGSGFVDAGPRGHLNAQSGLGEWDEGLRILAKLIG